MGLLRCGWVYRSHRSAEMEKKTKREMEKDTQLMRAVVSEVQSINKVITHCGKDRSINHGHLLP